MGDKRDNAERGNGDNAVLVGLGPELVSVRVVDGSIALSEERRSVAKRPELVDNGNKSNDNSSSLRVLVPDKPVEESNHGVSNRHDHGNLKGVDERNSNLVDGDLKGVGVELVVTQVAKVDNTRNGNSHGHARHNPGHNPAARAAAHRAKAAVVLASTPHVVAAVGLPNSRHKVRSKAH